MPWNISNSLSFLCVAALVVMVAGCETGTPEEKIAKVRAQYKVELNSWRAQELPQAEPPMAEEAGEAVAEAAVAAEAAAVAGEEAAEGEGHDMEEEIAESGPRSYNVLFDLVVYFRGKKALDGITVDVTHNDAAQQEKAVYQQWIETAGMVNGDTRQVDFLLEGMEVEEGDAFAVTLASGVPADLGNYPEFSEPAP